VGFLAANVAGYLLFPTHMDKKKEALYFILSVFTDTIFSFAIFHLHTRILHRGN
jgi:hypothetical protein